MTRFGIPHRRRSPRSLFAGIRRRFHVPDVERDLDDELAFHFERTVEELTERGLSEPEAREEARRRFGDEGRYRRELERIDRRMGVLHRWREGLGALGRDFGYACRRLGRSPALTLGVVLTLALGIGANATMFGILDRLLLRPPAHITDPETVRRIAVLRKSPHGQIRGASDWMSYPDVRDLFAAESFSDVAAYTLQHLILGRGETARRVSAGVVSGTFFHLLGVRPAHGRLFGPADDRPGAPGVAVLGHGFWQRSYDGDPSVIGRTVDFGHGPYEIVGIAPEGFTGVDLEPVDLWLPIQIAGEDLRGTRWREARNWFWMHAVARIAPGVMPQQADAEATALHLGGRRELIEAGHYDAGATVQTAPLISARGPLASDESRVARWLAGVALVVLLIAGANVANLLLARTLRRRRESGIRLALGITRRRLFGQVLIESLLLAVLGGAAALLVTEWGSGVLRTLLLPDVAWIESPIAGRVVLVSLALCLLTGFFAGTLPALQASRSDVVASLKSSSGTAGRGGSRARGALTVAQAALSVVLLAGAGLFLRSLHNVRTLDLGFDPEGVVVIEPIYAGDARDESQGPLLQQAVERLPELPGIEHASASVSVPFYSANVAELSIPGVDPLPELPSGPPVIHAVGPDYLPLMRLPVLRGRALTPADGEGSTRVALVNETMARVMWPEGDASGKCLVIEGLPCTRIVGVVADAKVMELEEEPTMQYYVPLSQSPFEGPPEALLARVSDEGAADTIRHALLALDPDLRFVEIQPFPELIDPQARSWRLGATLFTLFGVLALLVAAVGLYSVLAFAVAQRTQEIGIRAALGAGRKNLIALVLGQSLRLVTLGVAIGLAAVWALAPRVQPLLFETPARDFWTLGAVAGILLLTALLAGSLPAWRATRLDPNLALRAE
jgi:predicted permease